MPIQPTAHYAMGGIPTNADAEVVTRCAEHGHARLYAAGEVRLRVVHGANRLGTNSLVDIVVFGRARRAKWRRLFTAGADWPRLPENPEAERRAELDPSVNPRAAQSAAGCAARCADMMMRNVGVFRTEELLERRWKRLQS